MAEYMKYLTSNKKATSLHKKVKTEAIEEYQALNLLKNENLEKMPIFSQFQEDFKRKHCIMKPTKNKINEFYLKHPENEIQNYTTEEKPTNNLSAQNIKPKRSGSAADNRKYLKLDSDKENELNHEDKDLNEQNPKWKNLIKQSFSTIFNEGKEQEKNILKTSHSLVRVRSQKHLMFCASKLPKDFFGESIFGENYNNDNEQKIIFGSHGHIGQEESNLRKAGFRKIIFGENKAEKLAFSDKKGKNENEISDPEFTFRKEKSKKMIESKEEVLEQTPRFEHKRQITESLRKNESLPSLNKKANFEAYLNAKKKVFSNLTKNLLQL